MKGKICRNTQMLPINLVNLLLDMQDQMCKINHLEKRSLDDDLPVLDELIKKEIKSKSIQSKEKKQNNGFNYQHSQLTITGLLSIRECIRGRRISRMNSHQFNKWCALNNKKWRSYFYFTANHEKEKFIKEFNQLINSLSNCDNSSFDSSWSNFNDLRHNCTKLNTKYWKYGYNR